ncbi:mandelate racemase/muconate lactonizing enzyme family protein [Natronospira bacteriovora]|uniref:Dipeptide epimerase n=1 Tax=Natronospira bacteriovora TaxID=3069753 RepID=A0ABU0W7F6_9GAMM|nr:dipeptide epimerase [Natronospira sp. AB-CW4]MDQ2069965.1 dipeptide epimerase [Natronospira sp. AB-CW4]
MRILRIETWREDIPLSRPYEIAFRRTEAVGNCFVRIIPSSGSPGLGCAAPEHHVTGETLDDCEAALDPGSLDWLINQDVRELPRLLRQLDGHLPDTPAARAALDMALHDVLSRQLDIPLAAMLGQCHESLPTSITIGIMGIEETLEEAAEYIGRGFRHLKVKTGQRVEEDVERIRRLRARFGQDIALRVDPNQGYGVPDLKRFMEAVSDCGVEFVEQPLASDYDMRLLSPGLRDQLAADESLLSPLDALRLAAPPRACGIFNIKLMKCGGIHAARRIADIADLTDIHLMWGCMDESRISIAAALHAALASPATRYLDLDGHLDLGRDPASGGFTLENGVMRLDTGAGLGVTLSE